MASDRPPSRVTRTPRERAAIRRYAIEMAVAVIALLALLLVPLAALAPDAGPVLRVTWALLPIVPVLGIVAAVARYVNRVDELQRRVVLESLSVGFAAAMLAALTCAFIRSAGLDVGEVEWTVFLGGMLTFGVTVAIRSWTTTR